ncbi:MAG: hypothetical protein V7647_2060 [Acidobacteriota bacterium]|jgi:hypothetical protein
MAALAAVVLAFGWYLFGTRYTPAGQPPLATVQAESLDALRSDFNQHADSVRVIVLLSPS